MAPGRSSTRPCPRQSASCGFSPRGGGRSASQRTNGQFSGGEKHRRRGRTRERAYETGGEASRSGVENATSSGRYGGLFAHARGPRGGQRLRARGDKGALLEEAKELFGGIIMRHLWLVAPATHRQGERQGLGLKKVLGWRAHTYIHRLKGPRRRWVRVPEGEEPPPPRPTREKRRVSLLLCCPEAVGRGGGARRWWSRAFR